MLSVNNPIPEGEGRVASFASVDNDESIRKTEKIGNAYASPSAAPAITPELLLENIENLNNNSDKSQNFNNSQNINDSNTFGREKIVAEKPTLTMRPEAQNLISEANAFASAFLSDAAIRTWWDSYICKERPEFSNEDVFNKFGCQYGFGTTLTHVEQKDLKCKIIGSRFGVLSGRQEAVYVLELCEELVEKSDLVQDGQKTLEAGVIEIHQHWDWKLDSPPVKHFERSCGVTSAHSAVVSKESSTSVGTYTTQGSSSGMNTSAIGQYSSSSLSSAANNVSAVPTLPVTGAPANVNTATKTASTVPEVLPCSRGGRTLVLTMHDNCWTESFYLNKAWERFENVAFCDKHRWNKEWIMAGQNVLLDYEIVIVDDKFLDTEWDTFSPALRTYFVGGGGIILLAHNNRPQLIPKLNALIGCNWQYDGLQRENHDMVFEITPRCRQLYEQKTAEEKEKIEVGIAAGLVKEPVSLGNHVPTKNMNFITVPARERLLKALPEEDLNDDPSVPEEEKFHNLPDEYTPCGVHYGQLQAGGQRPGMLFWMGAAASDEHDFWPLIFREVIAQRIEKTKKKRRRQKKNKGKNGSGENDSGNENTNSEISYAITHASLKANSVVNAYKKKQSIETNTYAPSYPSTHSSPEYNPSFHPHSAYGAHGIHAHGHGEVFPRANVHSKSSTVDSLTGIITGTHGAHSAHGAPHHYGSSYASHGNSSSHSHHALYHRNTTKESTLGSEYSPTNLERRRLESERLRAEEEIRRRLDSEALLNFGIYRDFDPTRYTVINKIVISRNHYVYVNQMPDGRIVKYQQAGPYTYFFIDDDIFSKTMSSEWKWTAKNESYVSPHHGYSY